MKKLILDDERRAKFNARITELRATGADAAADTLQRHLSELEDIDARNARAKGNRAR